MKRGPIIHGILLVAALVFAYQTWTREETVAPLTGDVVVWSMPAASIQVITFTEEGREIRIERRSDAQGPYLWGTEKRTIQQYQPRKKDAPDAAPTDDRPFAPETVSTTREFVVGKKGEELLTNLSELRALRAMGKIDEDKKNLYDLHEKTKILTVLHSGGTRTLVIGGKVFGGADLYVLDPATGEGHVLAQVVLRDLANGEPGLRLSEIHEFKDEEVGRAVIDVRGQKRTLVRITAADERGRETRTWADAQTPDKPDQTMANFVRNIDMLRPARFVSNVDLSTLPRLVRVEYQTAAGASLGWVELFEQPGASKPDSSQPAQPQQPAQPARGQAAEQGQKDEARRPAYLMRTEMTRVPAAVPYTAATRITEDIDQIFGQ
jgi:hypothetical protein